ncbi:MAG: GAF domain-containing protein [Ardenticatenaceae bacterium]|nr:GAF domain-containing protein [Ardenticatenaceae bacterium]MCB9444347.1 GAF domain-containing protein [Ardenticatenaceae bacterium]
MLLPIVVHWHYTDRLYVINEFITALIALFVGLLALVRFFTKKNIPFLFISTGFVGAALLDGYQAVASGLIGGVWLSIDSWNVSSTFVAILLMGSWLAWRREEGEADSSRLRGLWLYASFLLAACIVLIVLTVLPHPSTTLPVYRLGRVEIFVSSTFTLVALIGYLDKGHWRHDLFEHWLVLALIIGLAANLLFAPVLHSYQDVVFTMSHLLKQGSYLFVLVGLLLSMYAIFKQAERDATELIQANLSLQLEIAERKKVERAEEEQRELAEALREVANALSTTLVFEEVLDRLLDQIARVLPYDTANVMLVRGEDSYIFGTRGYEKFEIEVPRHFPITRIPSLQQMIETERPLIVPDTAVYPQWVNAERSPHVRSWAGAPILLDGQVIAFLALNNSQPNFYKPEDAVRLSAFTGQASVAIRNTQLYEEVQNRVKELTALNDVSQAVISTLDLDETLKIVTQQITRILDVAATSVGLRSEKRGDLWFAAASGEAADFVVGQRMALGQGILGWVAQNGQPLLIPDVSQDARYFSGFDQESGFKARSILCVPLQVRGKTIGAIEALNKRDGRFTDEDLRLLSLLAAPAATAIENAQLYQKAQKEIAVRRQVERTLESERALLAQRVAERTADLSAANAELSRASRLKDEFLASMSHELRTPLNAVLGMSEAMQDEILGPLNDNQKYSLRTIEESGRHLLSLINDILDVSKIEAGKLPLNKSIVSVASVCEASLRFIKQTALKKRLKIVSDVDTAVSTLWADERRLKQILVNLLSNAVKFTPTEGMVGLEVKGDAAREVVDFTVWDTGIGINQEDMPRLFHPFVQLDSRLNRQFAGTGLGLSLVYRMAELHGGGVSLESEVGQGSRFTVSLPWQEKEAQPGTIEKLANTTIFTGLLNASNSNYPIQVLLAEDNEANISMMVNYLTAKGCEVIVARNGAEAVGRARELRPDIVLMDIQMPEMDGLEAIRILRSESGLEKIPIIALTALAMTGDRERCLEAGADDYLGKPISMKSLVTAIEQNLHRNLAANAEDVP